MRIGALNSQRANCVKKKKQVAHGPSFAEGHLKASRADEVGEGKGALILKPAVVKRVYKRLGVRLERCGSDSLFTRRTTLVDTIVKAIRGGKGGCC